MQQNWISLQKRVCVIAALGTLHFAMGRKVIGPEMMFYIAAAVLLLGYRLIRPKLMERKRARKKAARMQVRVK